MYGSFNNVERMKERLFDSVGDGGWDGLDSAILKMSTSVLYTETKNKRHYRIDKNVVLFFPSY